MSPVFISVLAGDPQYCPDLWGPDVLPPREDIRHVHFKVGKQSLAHVEIRPRLKNRIDAVGRKAGLPFQGIGASGIRATLGVASSLSASVPP